MPKNPPTARAEIIAKPRTPNFTIPVRSRAKGFRALLDDANHGIDRPRGGPEAGNEPIRKNRRRKTCPKAFSFGDAVRTPFRPLYGGPLSSVRTTESRCGSPSKAAELAATRAVGLGLEGRRSSYYGKRQNQAGKNNRNCGPYVSCLLAGYSPTLPRREP